MLLLKTRSLPVDTYEELFNQDQSASTGSDAAGTADTNPFRFTPKFIPVLEHTQNEASLSRLSELLRTRQLKRKYGGMIFTSQRAVEAWTDIVHNIAPDDHATPAPRQKDDAFSDLDSLTPFPLYVVGPATERTLQTLIDESRTKGLHLFSRLNPSVHGANSGNGAALAEFMLKHYNQLQEEHYFTYFEAPRLPFIPLLGMSSQNYGRKRLERDDPRLVKRPLLFLVGEVRRDIIPKTLMGQEEEKRKIGVEEMEVYSTEVMKGFEEEFRETCESLDSNYKGEVRVVVVFSPQGSDSMLKRIGYLGVDGKVTERAQRRWWAEGSGEKDQPRWIVTTIGPTTRDYLKDKLGIEPDVCAKKPSPEGLREAIRDFLTEKNVQI